MKTEQKTAIAQGAGTEKKQNSNIADAVILEETKALQVKPNLETTIEKIMDLGRLIRKKNVVEETINRLENYDRTQLTKEGEAEYYVQFPEDRYKNIEIKGRETASKILHFTVLTMRQELAEIEAQITF